MSSPFGWRNKKGAIGDVSQSIIDLAAQPGGVTNQQLREAHDISVGIAGGKLAALTKHGHLFQARLPGEPHHWFATPAARDAFVREHSAAAAPAAPVETVRDRVLSVISTSNGAQAMTVAATLDVAVESIRKHLCALEKSGRAFRTDGSPPRFFGREADRDQWLAQPSPKLVPPTQKKWLMDMNGRDDLARAPLARNRPGRQIVLPGCSKAHPGKVASGKPDGDVDYSRAKLTICPSPAVLGAAARVYVEDDGHVFGAGFSKLGPGRYLEDAR